ncbi:NPCBM/NEW2 domain-containing protein [Bacillus cereus]|uniref:NPCBM/NEW2 domain-containing protein n=1 Tax=Bacillus cereus TaxID=1396 RepID=UPI000BF5880F|nr:NPCBM/NEW2 domain-containing protein [Bacillus cereus]PFV39489.1 hypothetical protein COL00_27055 [Bacillus cereus]PGQ05643.1 hypothetical protein COA09_26735 [Bacillus cereus]PGS48622.1 hypothetical protein COC67_28930 [Bacillus cereus]PGU90628.1 hypothetical protein COD77_30185 [Bacillus cereus]
MFQKSRVILLALAITIGLFLIIPASTFAAENNQIIITSDNEMLTNSFNKAKKWALNLDATLPDIITVRKIAGCPTPNIGCEDPRVKDKYNVKPLIPAYWGAYLNREAFYTRDIAHQANAGHLLNMDEQNFSMIKTFAKGANTNKINPYWPKWSYDFFGDPYYMDADWRELPAPFELVQRSYEQYLWTGDHRWIDDPDLFNYYTNTHTYFMNSQDQDGDGVADETKQLATYWEDTNTRLFEAGDAIGSQYQALLAYSNILRERGDAQNAELYLNKANNLRTTFEKNWYSNTDNTYIRAFKMDSNNKKVGLTSFGHENSIFMPLKLITDQGTKTATYLKFIHESILKNDINIEAKTYLPELFYMHGQNDWAWHWQKDIMNSNNTYPEVSFLIISNTISGLMGIQPDAPHNKVDTVPRLTNDISWVQAEHVRIGNNDLMIQHNGNTKTTLRNNTGPDFTWDAQFYGDYSQLLVNGNLQNTKKKNLNGKTVSYVSVPVREGDTITVKVPTPPSVYTEYLSNLKWVSAKSDFGTVNKDKSVIGNLLKLNNETYSKGIGTHANSEIVYLLNKQCDTFTADIGIDDEITNSGNGSVIFQVYGDGNKIFDSGIMNPLSATKHINVSVQGIHLLKLVVTDAGDGINSDHADWGNAKIIYPWSYISDLDAISTKTSWKQVQIDKSVYDRTLTLEGVQYLKGIGAHADSEIVYNLNGQYSRFTSNVGVDDEVGPNGSVVFQVFADNIKVYDSEVMTGNTPTKYIDVDITGKKQLKLVVTNSGDGINNDHADWADTKLFK